MTNQAAVRNTGVLSIRQGIIVEPQMSLIREANHLRAPVGLSPLKPQGETGERKVGRRLAGRDGRGGQV